MLRRAVPLYVLLSLGLAVLPYGWFPMGRKDFAYYTPLEYLLVALLVVPGYLLAFLIWREKREQQRPIRWYFWLSIPVLYYLSRKVSDAIIGISDFVPPEPDPLTPRIVIALLIMIIHTVILGPMAEEWLFRAWLLPEKAGVLSIIGNAALFALIHPWGRITPFTADFRFHAATFFVGLVLATSKRLSGNTWFVVVLHMVINLFSIVTIDTIAAAP